MSARIVELSDYLLARKAGGNQPAPLAQEPTSPFQFWIGASRNCYVHSTYSLLGCPALPPCTYVLVRREENGSAVMLANGRLEHASPSLNLATIRHRGAKLGANEVHVHLLASAEDQRRSIEADVAAAGHGLSAAGRARTH